MLDKFYVKATVTTLSQCAECRAEIEDALKLTAIRLSRLQATQQKNPKWAFYDKYADDIVGIGTRIEEQQAGAEDLAGDLQLISDREASLSQAACYKEKPPAPKAIQLGFFDTAIRRERMGAPC